MYNVPKWILILRKFNGIDILGATILEMDILGVDILPYFMITLVHILNSHVVPYRTEQLFTYIRN